MDLADPARTGADAPFAGTGARVEDVRAIAVLRANAVGDFVVTLPALWALRRAYPHARLVLMGRRWHADFLRDRPSPVDEVVPVPEAIDLRSPVDVEAPAVAAWLAPLRTRRFDLALQLHGGGRHTNPLVRALDARVTAGLRSAGAPALDRWLPYRERHPEVLRLLETVALVGGEGRDLVPRLAVTAADRAEAARAVAEASRVQGVGDASPDRPLVVLQPGCTDPRRMWPADRFAAVGDQLAREGACVVLNGTAAEAATLARVRGAMRQPALDLGGRLSVGGLVGLLAGARLLVTNDTGPAHLARALDVPSVTVCWIGNLVGYGPVSCRRHAVAVSWRLACPRCGRPNVAEHCGHDESFVDDVQVDEVLSLARSLDA